MRAATTHGQGPGRGSSAVQTPAHEGIPHRDRCAHRPAQQRRRDPSARVRRVQGPAGADRGRDPDRARDRLPARRHRADVRQRGRRRPGRAGRRPGPGRGVRHQQAGQPHHARDDALRSFDGTLAELGFDHVDLFLIHWPLPEVGDFVETWHAMEEIYRSGRARAIGVSNFDAAPPAPAAGRGRGGPGGEPDRGAPLPGPGRRAGLRRRARDRHRGLGPDRPRPGARRPGDHHDRQAAGAHAGPGHAALAHPAR